ERIAVRLGGLAPARRRFGRARDPNSTKRVHLATALKGVDRELQAALDEQARLVGRLGDASRLAPEHAFQQGRAEMTQRHTYRGAARTECRLEHWREIEANRDLDAGIER